MLHFGMDDPNVNLQSQKLFLGSDKLAVAHSTFLNIGTCVLYILHNAFKKGVKFCRIKCRSIYVGF